MKKDWRCSALLTDYCLNKMWWIHWKCKLLLKAENLESLCHFNVKQRQFFSFQFHELKLDEIKAYSSIYKGPGGKPKLLFPMSLSSFSYLGNHFSREFQTNKPRIPWLSSVTQQWKKTAVLFFRADFCFSIFTSSNMSEINPI